MMSAMVVVVAVVMLFVLFVFVLSVGCCAVLFTALISLFESKVLHGLLNLTSVNK
jgi:hypothetical protein